jgi:arylsulfatase A-like enzyme
LPHGITLFARTTSAQSSNSETAAALASRAESAGSPEVKKLYICQARSTRRSSRTRDYEIGRVIQAIADVGKLENTLVIHISGDTGACPEDALHGLFNEFASRTPRIQRSSRT